MSHHIILHTVNPNIQIIPIWGICHNKQTGNSAIPEISISNFSFAEHAQNFWKILIPMRFHFIIVLIFWIMVKIVYHILQKRKKETEN
jgi:hypothetical protein